DENLDYAIFGGIDRNIKLQEILVGTQITADPIEMLSLLNFGGFVDYLLPVFINFVILVVAKSKVVVVIIAIELKLGKVSTEIGILDIIIDNINLRIRKADCKGLPQTLVCCYFLF